MSLPILAGAALGLTIAAPLGPVSLMCIQRSLVRGPLNAIVGGLGAATAHLGFAAVATMAAAAVALHLEGFEREMRIASALVLAFVALRSLRRRASLDADASVDRTGAAFLSGLGLALCNPVTVLRYIGAAPGLLVNDGSDAAAGCLTVLGILIGVLAWYATLSLAASLLRGKLARGLLPRLHIVSGLALIAMAARIGLA